MNGVDEGVQDQSKSPNILQVTVKEHQSHTCYLLQCDIITSPVPVCLSGGDHEGLPAPQRGGDVPQRSGGGGTLGNHGVPAGRRSHPHRQ